MDISFSGQLTHVFQAKSMPNQVEQRFGIQVLETPSKGDTSKRAELHTYKLPKGVNPNLFTNKIGSNVTVALTVWASDGRTGFYIADINDIHVQQEAKAA